VLANIGFNLHRPTIGAELSLLFGPRYAGEEYHADLEHLALAAPVEIESKV